MRDNIISADKFQTHHDGLGAKSV